MTELYYILFSSYTFIIENYKKIKKIIIQKIKKAINIKSYRFL
jgi:hypothetical protein